MSIVMSRAPFRVSFFGGGSDYPTWLDNEPGAVLSTTIDKYIYITCRYLPPYLGSKHRVVWRYVETVDSIAEILHPAVREGLRFLKFDDRLGIEMHYQGDLPSQSGMGSSSTFAVAMLHALMALRGKDVDRQTLAEMAIELEQECLKDTVGYQDQVAAAFGGINLISFPKRGTFDVNPILLPKQRERDFVSHLMLIFLGRRRLGGGIASDVVQNLADRSTSIRRMVQMVSEGAAILRHGDLDDFGRLLHEAWELKRGLAVSVSNSDVDDFYRRGREAGAIGGKLLGAGGTGFLLMYVPPDRQEAVRQAMSPCVHVPFALDHDGACVVYRATDSLVAP